MSKIHVLSEILASQVAAGEVVERPASVVKELIENSLDAGATHIQVEIQKGGVAYIKVSDNGSGMSKEDALLCLERHATSKLKSSEELMQIATMGFRGEALPSIASVSRFKLITCEAGAIEGTDIVVDGGTLREVKTAGVSNGTVIEVKQLFFNVPARRKFLKTETTEAAHIEYQVRLHALSAPHVRFTFLKDHRKVLDLPATGDRRVRIIGIMGQSVAQSLLEVPLFKRHGMELCGFLLPAEFSRKVRRNQFLFLNGRPVEDGSISRALRDGFRGAVAEGMHPSVWLWLTMHPSTVDVNVHPAKKEVRFQYPHDVRFLVTEAIESALAQRASPSAEEEFLRKITNEQSAPEQPSPSQIAPKQAQGLHPAKKFTASEPIEGSIAPDAIQRKVWSPDPVGRQPELIENKVQAGEHLPSFDPMGILHGRYILMQGDEGLVVLDPKAARRRIVYDEVMTKQGEITSQGLLLPEVVELDAQDFDIVLRNLDHFNDAGVQMEEFGGNSFQVSGLPDFVKLESPRKWIVELIDALVASQETARGKKVTYDLFAKKIAQQFARYEPVDLARVDCILGRLFTCELPYCDPEGDPTLVQIAMQELDKKFGKRSKY